MAEKKSEGTNAKEGTPVAAQKKEEEEFCPLFMDGLPSNFSNNKSLAAIASLLDDEDHSEKQSLEKEDGLLPKVELKSGGGKVQRSRRRKGSGQASPYNKDKKKVGQDKKTASIGEAQLFLNLWKI